MTAALERRYRRLLLAYPSTYRVYRGEEIVSTLCDGARPRQRFPRPVEALDLVAGGLRERLGGPASTPLADGLRLALPIALVLTAISAASAHVDSQGPWGAPFLQPWVYAWAVALVAWTISPGLGRVAIVLSALATLRVAAMWSWRIPETQLVCVFAMLAGYVAVAAPPHSTTVDGRGSGAALWSLPGRLGAAAVAATLGAFGAVNLDFGQPVLLSVTLAPLVLAVVGLLARSRRRSGLLWAALVMAPVFGASVLIWLRFGNFWAWASFGPALPLIGGWNDSLLDFGLALTLTAAVLIAHRSGRRGLAVASRMLTFASLVAMACVLIAFEIIGGLPAIAVVAGAAALAIAGVAAMVLPRPVSWALLGLGAAAVLSDFAGAERERSPWPLVVLAALALLAALQAPARWAGSRLAMLGWIGATLLIVGGYAFVATRGYHNFLASLTVWETPISLVALPACALAVVAAAASARREPVLASFTVFVGLACVMALAAPMRAVAVIGGVSAAGAVSTALAARHGRPAPS
jgi:hypothetical protein